MSFINNARHAFMGEDDSRDFEENTRKHNVKYEEEAPEDYEEIEEDNSDEDFDDKLKKGFFSIFSRGKEKKRDEKKYKSSHSYESDDSEYDSEYDYGESGYNSGRSTYSNSEYQKASPKIEVIAFYPQKFDDSKKIVQELKNSKIVLLDVNNAESTEQARRMVDYIGGASEGLDFSFERICATVFCICPKGVRISLRKKNY